MTSITVQTLRLLDRPHSYCDNAKLIYATATDNLMRIYLFRKPDWDGNKDFVCV